MEFDKALVAGKLRRWEKYLINYHLPKWEDLPDFGLYMEQVIVLLKQYLDYLPPELKDEECITAATVNNYVRKHIVPEPVKKKYYRTHLAYLVIICTLKQSLSIPTIQPMVPVDMTEEELKKFYESYTKRHQLVASYFIDDMRLLAADILDHEERSELTAETTEDLITAVAIYGGLSRLLAEKLLLLSSKKENAPADEA